MKITEKKGFIEDNKKYIKILLYLVLIVVIAIFSFLVWEKIKPVPEIDINVVSMPENKSNLEKRNYIYLVTDDSDYINNELSIERYKTLLELIKQNKDQVLWNVLFSGAEFEYLKRTNQENKILHELKKQHKNDYTEIGYSAKNESKYQSDLRYIPNRKDITFKEKVKKAYEFLTCGKDIKNGICMPYADNQGGPGIIKLTIGDFYVNSGIETDSIFSHDSVVKALSDISNKNIISLNFPKDKIKNINSVKKLINILSPTNETLSTAFWMNNGIVIMDFDVKNNIDKIDTVKSKNILRDVKNIGKDNERSITPVYFGGTNLYSKINPIQYAYEHGGYEKLPINEKFRQLEKDELNKINAENFKILTNFVYKNNNFEFINGEKIHEKVLSKDFKNVTKSELDRMARWIIIEWNKNGRIPSWVYDGKNYYSLRDAFYLLYQSFSERKKYNEYSLPKANIELEDVYGPYKVKSDTTINTKISRKIVMEIVIDYMKILKINSYWDDKEDDSYGNSRDTIDGFYRRERKQITAAEMLYAMSVIYTSDFNGRVIDYIYIPTSKTYPETYELLRDGFGCKIKEDCIATSWSLKPLKI